MGQEMSASLHAAVRKGDIDSVKGLLALKIDINSVAEEKRTLLHVAVENNNVEMVNFLLSQGARIDLKNSLGLTPLSCALFVGYFEIADVLIAAGGDVDDRNDDGCSTLMSVVLKDERNHKASSIVLLIKELLARGADVDAKCSGGFTALLMAICEGKLEIAKCLIDAGADVFAKNIDGDSTLHCVSLRQNPKNLECAELLMMKADLDVNSQNNDGETPLHLAVERSNIKVLKFLLSQGATVESRTKLGITPLCTALIQGKLEIADILIEAGGNVNSQDNNGNMALMWPTGDSRNGGVQLVKDILARGADINLKANEGQTALHSAVHNGNFDVAKCLIEAGADVKCRDNSGYSALHMAAKHNDTSIVQSLLSHGADVNAKNEDFETAFRLAVLDKNFAVADLLIKAGSDVNALDKRRQTALYDAVALVKHDVSIIKYLLNRKVNFNSKDSFGRTALTYAFDFGKLDLADPLIEAGGDVNEKDMDGNTALLRASASKNRENKIHGVQLIKELISRGADIAVKNYKGQTALQMAIMCGNLEEAKFLIDAGIDVNCQTTAGNAALHLNASFHNDASLIRPLLSRGADVNMKNNQGLTPLQLAEYHDKPAVVKELLSCSADNEGKKKATKKAPKLGSSQLRLMSDFKTDGVHLFQMSVVRIPLF